mmetsp:Transcript_25787/g.58038  ORF Transcript_25787/g.58038 Transcript_25787/m.58038 type:complete len:213 (-) Transcript_25787:53-691(-)|eukprot:767980-Hanusia_phi.AAC.1
MEGPTISIDGRTLPEAMDWGFDHVPNDLHGLSQEEDVELRQKKMEEANRSEEAREGLDDRRGSVGDLSCGRMKSKSPETFAAMFCSRFEDGPEKERLENVFASESYNIVHLASAERDCPEDCGKDFLDAKDVDLDDDDDEDEEEEEEEEEEIAVEAGERRTCLYQSSFKLGGEPEWKEVRGSGSFRTRYNREIGRSITDAFIGLLQTSQPSE